MARNLYAKYSQKEKKRGKTRVNLLLLVIFVGLISLVYFLRKNINTPFAIVNDALNPQIEDQVGGEVEVIEDTAENLLFWWDYDYSSYRQLTVRNNSSSAIPEKSWVSVNIAHSRFVQDGKSLAHGDDLRIVYLEGEKYIELEMDLKNPNTASTQIAFKTINPINGGSNDNKYFLYYNNSSAKKFSQSSVESSSFDTDYFITYSKEQSPKLVASTSRKWVLKDDPDPRKFVFEVNSDVPLKDSVTYEVVGSARKGVMTRSSDNNFSVELKVKDFAPGKYFVQATTELADPAIVIKSKKIEFFVSYPLYVTWTQDWEGYDVSDQYLSDMESISTRHALPITHFFNPRIYIANDIPGNRVSAMTNWIKNRAQHSDEIALHLHMHFDLIRAAGVDVRTSPNWGGRENGHDVLTSAYDYNETVKILNWSKEQFTKYGLGTPTSFRAGGWFTDSETLKALQDSGFLLDSSGRTAYNWGPNNIQGDWNLSTTTRPYKPSTQNQNSILPGPVLNLWEFPNNGADSWTYQTDDLINRFKENYRGGTLNKKQIVTYLSHPHWFNTDRPKIDTTFNYIDGFLYSRDLGPVKYTTLEQARKVWEKYPD